MATIDTILNIQVTGTDKMTQLKNAIDNTAEELKQFKKEGQRTGESLKEYQARVVTAETKLKGLRGELTKSKSELVKNAKAAGDTSKSYNSLTAQNAKLSAQLRKLSDPLGKNRKEFDKLSGKIKQNTAQLKQMDAAMGRQQRNVGNYKQAIGGVATAVGAAIIAFKTFQRVLGTFVEFEFQIKQVGVISGATAEEMTMLSDSAKALGASTAFTAGEVAGLQKELAKLGFNPTEIENMTSATLDLAFAFGNELAETGELVGVVLNSYRLDASEATRVTDVLAAAFSSTALDLQKFNTAFPKVGAIANQLGFSLEGTTALLGELSNAGLEASTAGTSLRSIFLKLADSNSALSQQFGGSVTSIDQLLPALNDLFESGANVEEMLGLTDKRSVTAFATLASGANEVATLTKSFENSAGTAAKFADVMRDSLKGSLDAATSAANGFVIELFESLEPVISLLVDGMGLLFNALSALVENFKAIAIGVGAYGVVVAAASVAQGTFTSSILGSKAVTIVWNGVVKIARALQTAWNFALSANPIGLVVGAITTGIAVLLSWNAATADGVDEQKELNKTTDDTIKKVDKLGEIRKKNAKQQTEELAKLRQLKEAIKDSNRTQKEREDALKSFNKLAGTNITNLQNEKDIIQDVEKAYDGAVDAIKRKIILQSTEQQIVSLLEDQIEVEKKIAEQKKNVAEQTIIVQDAEKELDVINQKRVANNARSVEQLIADGDKLIDNTARLGSNSEIINTTIANTFDELQEATNGYGGTLNSQIPANIQLLQQQSEAAQNAADETADANEKATTSFEDLSLGSEASAETTISAYQNVGNETEILEAETNNLNQLNTQNASISEQIATIYAEQDAALSQLNTTTNKNSFATGKSTTAYQRLQNEVKKYNEIIIDEIVKGEQAKSKFLESNEAKEMSTEEVNAEIQRIENETATKVEAATNKAIDAKNDLIEVDKQVAQQNEIIATSTTNYIDELENLQKSGQKVIDADKRQLAVLKELEDAGADVARERIELALKVAKAELDLALKTAEASDLSTDAQIENIRRLRGEIEGFETQLSESGDDGIGTGFMNKVLFGSTEDGTAFTGADFVAAVDVSLSAVNDVMTSFNQLQQEQLNTKLGQ
jgi:TP901 family phage tail tape measure protein